MPAQSLHSLPLTKFLHREDLTLLEAEVRLVETIPMPNGHEWRAWEYGMALRAFHAWQAKTAMPAPWVLGLDVGGAGSEFHRVLAKVDCRTLVVDPSTNWTLETFLAQGGAPAQAVFCISVLEHVPASGYHRFLDSLMAAVVPGGLLFLTADARELPEKGSLEPDSCHFSWMRSRIYDPVTWRGVLRYVERAGFSLLGNADWRWRGHQVYDYSFCSMALVRAGAVVVPEVEEGEVEDETR